MTLEENTMCILQTQHKTVDKKTSITFTNRDGRDFTTTKTTDTLKHGLEKTVVYVQKNSITCKKIQ